MAQLIALTISLGLPVPESTAGGIIAADVNNDHRVELLVTVPGHIGAYTLDGETLWIARAPVVVSVQSEHNGLPGHHGPGITAGDVDDDGACEVIFCTLDGQVAVLDGATGRIKQTIRPPVPAGAQRWELAMVADFRGTGDHDVLLQATNADGYRTGRYLAAYAYEDLLAGGEPLWATDSFVACAHNGARLADLNGDGRDEVLGGVILGPDGRVLVAPERYRGHIDSVFVGDVQPQREGLEVVLLEEGSNRVQLLALDGVRWRSHLREQEPQNAALGRFRAGSDAMFVWCRSRYNTHQKPFVFDSEGQLVGEYEMDDVAPAGWTDEGVEVIHTIDWTGRDHQLACAKERHTEGDVCLFEPISGEFVLRIAEQADRLYVADVLGDWREEIIVWAGDELHVYQNPAENPNPDRERLWHDRNYRRLKQCHNYYSP